MLYKNTMLFLHQEQIAHYFRATSKDLCLTT